MAEVGGEVQHEGDLIEELGFVAESCAVEVVEHQAGMLCLLLDVGEGYVLVQPVDAGLGFFIKQRVKVWHG